MSPRLFVPRVALFVGGTCLLCLPAIWNGFPLVFDDVGGYMEPWPEGELRLGRSAAYGWLLWATRSTSFVPVVVLQALVTVFVVEQTVSIIRPNAGAGASAGAVALIAATSGAALFVSKILPDAWAAPAVLALHLLAFHADRLGRPQRAAMAAIVAWAGASHMATFGLLVALSLLQIAGWLARRALRIALPGVGIAAAATWSGLALLIVIDFLATGHFAPTPGGPAILLGRLVEDGAAARTLAEQCSLTSWRLCRYRDELPDNAEAFIWGPDSPLQKIGGVADPNVVREMNAIVLSTMLTHPIENIQRAAVLTWEQFFDVGIGGAMEPISSRHLRWTLARYAPRLLPSYDAARQQSQDVDLTLWSDYLVVPVSIASSCLLPGLAVLSWRRGSRCGAALCAMIFLALVVNAAICGIVSSPNDRYQARLVCLAILAVGLSMPGPLRMCRIRGLSCGTPCGSPTGRRGVGTEANHPAADVVSHRSPA
jgi:hypothetical protein